MVISFFYYLIIVFRKLSAPKNISEKYRKALKSIKKHRKALKSIEKHISAKLMLYLCDAFQKQSSYEPHTKVIRSVAEEINRKSMSWR